MELKKWEKVLVLLSDQRVKPFNQNFTCLNVSKTLLEKVSKTVSMKKQAVLKKQAKKAKKKMKKKASQMKLTSFWGKPKPKPKPSNN